MSDTDLLLNQITEAINDGRITIKQIVEKIIPKKPKQTLQEKRAYQKQWRETHKEYQREYQKKYQLEYRLKKKTNE